jgi:hypothetical protein
LSLRSLGHVCVRNSDLIFRANTPLLYSALYHRSLFLGRDTSIVLASSPLLFSGRDFIFQANTLLLYSALYYCFFFSGRNTSIILASSPFLPSGYNRANTLLLYSVFYYCFFSSGYDPLVIFINCSFSRVASIFLFLVANLSLRAVPYYSLVFQPLLVIIVIPAVRIYPTSIKRLK